MDQEEKKEGPVIDAWKDRSVDRDNKLMTVAEWLEKHQHHTM